MSESARHVTVHALLLSVWCYRVSPKIRWGLILIFAPKDALGLIFQTTNYSTFTSIHEQKSTVINVTQEIVVADLIITRAYSWSRVYITSILKNHVRSSFCGRSYFRGNTVVSSTFGVCQCPKVNNEDEGTTLQLS